MSETMKEKHQKRIHNKNTKKRHTERFDHKKALKARHIREEEHIKFLEEEIEDLWHEHEFFES